MIADDYENQSVSTKRKKEIEKEYRRLEKKRNEHKGLWLTYEACKEYREKALALNDNSGLDIGERRRLRLEIQERYGLLEIEAINILNGFFHKEYVRKYYVIRNLIVMIAYDKVNIDI